MRKSLPLSLLPRMLALVLLLVLIFSLSIWFSYYFPRLCFSVVFVSLSLSISRFLSISALPALLVCAFRLAIVPFRVYGLGLPSFLTVCLSACLLVFLSFLSFLSVLSFLSFLSICSFPFFPFRAFFCFSLSLSLHLSICVSRPPLVKTLDAPGPMPCEKPQQP